VPVRQVSQRLRFPSRVIGSLGGSISARRSGSLCLAGHGVDSIPRAKDRSRSPQTRLAKVLLRFASVEQRTADGHQLLQVHLSQRELRNICGTGRESINKCLGLWQRRGIVQVEERLITVADRTALEELARLEGLPRAAQPAQRGRLRGRAHQGEGAGGPTFVVGLMIRRFSVDASVTAFCVAYRSCRGASGFKRRGATACEVMRAGVASVTGRLTLRRNVRQHGLRDFVLAHNDLGGTMLFEVLQFRLRMSARQKFVALD
jgi:Crp-like helix-turn-helix domain